MEERKETARRMGEGKWKEKEGSGKEHDMSMFELWTRWCSRPPGDRNWERRRKREGILLSCGYGDGRPYGPQHISLVPLDKLMQRWSTGLSAALFGGQLGVLLVSIYSSNCAERAVSCICAPSSCLHLNDAIRFFMFRTWNQCRLLCIIKYVWTGWSIDVQCMRTRPEYVTAYKMT